jgi:hypothetical protein
MSVGTGISATAHLKRDITLWAGQTSSVTGELIQGTDKDSIGFLVEGPYSQKAVVVVPNHNITALVRLVEKFPE